MRTPRSIQIAIAIVFAATLLRSIPVYGQTANSPRLTSVFPPGGQAGGECELTITGDALDGAQQLIFSDSSITASPQMGKADRFFPTPHAIANHFTVKIGPNVLPGSYALRLVGAMGVSNPRTFVVGNLPEKSRRAPESDASTPMQIDSNGVVNARFTPQAADYYQFSATRGQHLVIHCTARLIDSRAEPQMALYGPDGTLIRQVHDAVRVDPTLDFVVPADGKYGIATHDFVFGGGPDYGYRLSVSTGPWIEFVDPPFVSSGGESKHTLYGYNLPGSSAASEMPAGVAPLEKLEVTIAAPQKIAAAIDTLMQPADAGIDSFSYRFSGLNGISNPIRLARVDGPLVSEIEPNDTPDQAQPLTLPAQVVGRFNPRNDRDWYSFHARKGEKYWIEVISQRLGLPTDPHMTLQQVIKDAAGKITTKDLADVDDGPKLEDGGQGRFRVVNDDPAVVFTAPDDGDYRLMVEDLYSSAQGAPSLQYLLRIGPAHPGFRLLTYPARLTANEQATTLASTVLHKGTGSVIDVVALRRDGFKGAIQITADSLPPGVTARPGIIARGTSVGALMLQTASDAPDWAGVVRIVGRAAPDSDEETTRQTPAGPTSADATGSMCVALPVEVMFGAANGAQVAATRLAAESALAVRDGLSLPYTIEAGDGKVWRVPRGGKLQIPVKITRNPQFTFDEKTAERDSGEIRLQAVSQGQLRADALKFEVDATQKDLVVNVDPAAATGSYSLMLRATDAPAKISRGGEVAKAAADDFKRIDAICKQITDAAQKAAQARDRAEQAVQQSAAVLAQAKQQRLAAQQAFDAATNTSNESSRHLKQFDQAASAAAAAIDPTTKPTAAQLDATTRSKAAVAEGRRVTDDAAAKLKAASTALETAVRAETDAQQKSAEAEAARTRAIAADTAAKDDVKAADEARRIAEEQMRKTAELGKPRDLRTQIASPPILIEVVPAPFTMKIDLPPSVVQAGGQPVELSAAIMPEFGFADEVKFELVAPSGASGVSLPDKHNLIGKGETEGRLSLQADRAAPAGMFTFTLRAHYKFNNRDLTFDRPIPLQVSAAAKEVSAK